MDVDTKVGVGQGGRRGRGVEQGDCGNKDGSGGMSCWLGSLWHWHVLMFVLCTISYRQNQSTTINWDRYLYRYSFHFVNQSNTCPQRRWNDAWHGCLDAQ